MGMKTNCADVRMELVLPVFFGILASLVLCIFVPQEPPAFPADDSQEADLIAITEESDTEEQPSDLSLFLSPMLERRSGLILGVYRQMSTQEWVVNFFAKMCGSREIAAAILSNADAFNIAPSLAFSLSWEESRFNPNAVNNRNRDESIDRGLFQLNNRSFPNLEMQTFFNPKLNAWYGMGHLRHCLNTGGSEIAALAMYNAGAGRVRTSGAPKSTLDYISRILENRERIEEEFQSQLYRDFDYRITEKGGGPETLADVTGEFSEKLVQAKPERLRIVRLAPLAGR
jgi:hypothetical protein